MSVFIKICGLTRADDATVAAEAGARFGGVILAPGSPRTVPVDQVPGIFGDTRLTRCAVFVNESPESIAAIVREYGFGVVQLHGDESPAAAASIREDTGVEVWKAIRPRSSTEFAREADRYAGVVDGLLLDGWSAEARGGTGTRFPWAAVALERDRLDSDLRLAVAGGLRPDNVAEVIELLAPDVVDVSSGVEHSPGIKDPDLIRRFAEATRGGMQQERMDGGEQHG